MRIRNILIISISLFCCIQPLAAQLCLHGAFGDNMVIQRDKPVNIRGTAAKDETVTVSFNGQVHKTKADRQGKWNVQLDAMEFGGPFVLTAEGRDNKVEYGNILVGDIWLCSGQSNMEWSVSASENAENEIASAHYPFIRSLNTPKTMAWFPQENLPGQCHWDECSPATVGDFTAVGYYFAREVYRQTGIPIGIINSSWGGSLIEPWMSREAFASLPDSCKRSFDKELINSAASFQLANGNSLHGYSEKAVPDPGISEQWYSAGFDDSQWNTMRVPQEWSGTPLAHIDGIVWFRYEFDLPSSADGKQAQLHLGRIDDHDVTWVNSVEVGRLSGHNVSRNYRVPPGILKAGKNTVVVKVTDDMADGGITGEPEDIFIEIDGERTGLSGDWKYMPSLINEDFRKYTLGPNSFNSLLYGSMIYPFKDFAIKGFLWYQGESNTDMPFEYRSVFPAMIGDWRRTFDSELPFYWVQLANFMAKDDIPAESGWARLRDAQTSTLSLPHTGQAVTIDIGDAWDIHPRNKQEAGRRLALIALAKDYGRDNVVYTGPTFASMERCGNKLYLQFDLHGSSDLAVKNKYGYIEGFAVAGPDGIYKWAKAELLDGRVVVWNEDVAQPQKLRYGWGNNPDINIFNVDSLPVVPFETTLPLSAIAD